MTSTTSQAPSRGYWRLLITAVAIALTLGVAVEWLVSPYFERKTATTIAIGVCFGVGMALDERWRDKTTWRSAIVTAGWMGGFFVIMRLLTYRFLGW